MSLWRLQWSVEWYSYELTVEPNEGAGALSWILLSLKIRCRLISMWRNRQCRGDPGHRKLRPVETACKKEQVILHVSRNTRNISFKNSQHKESFSFQNNLRAFLNNSSSCSHCDKQFYCKITNRYCFNNLNINLQESIMAPYLNCIEIITGNSSDWFCYIDPNYEGQFRYLSFGWSLTWNKDEDTRNYCVHWANGCVFLMQNLVQCFCSGPVLFYVFSKFNFSDMSINYSKFNSQLDWETIKYNILLR